jgi:hypothetical protein
LSISVVFACGAAPVQASVSFSPAARVRPAGPIARTFVAKPKAPLLHPARRGAIVTGQTYTIVDVGAPSSTKFTNATPVGFNNTGQMYGTAAANATAPGTGPACLAYTGAAFIGLTSPTTIQGCQPAGISDAASGFFTIVASVQSFVNPNPSAFAATTRVNGRSTAAKPFASFPFSAIDGINGAGTIFGHSFNAAFPQGAEAVPYYFSGSAPAALQPACVVPGNGQGNCLSLYEYQPSFGAYPCPFGGCTIAPNGTLLVYDGSSGTYALSAPLAAQWYDVPQTITDGNGYANNFVDLQESNYGILAMDDITSPNLVGIATAAFVIGTTAWAVVPSLATSCTEHVPLSENNAGEILGYDTACGVSTDAGYWTWDPVNGVQHLIMPASTTYSSALPLGVNDNGQILVALNLAAGGPVHWGTFNPVAAAKATSGLQNRRGRKPQ